MSSSNEKEKEFIANFNVSESCDPIIELVTISHSHLPEPIRLNDSEEDVVAGGELYLACPFDWKKPSLDAKENSRPKFRISNIGRKMTEYIVLTNGVRCATVEFGITSKNCLEYVDPQGCFDLLNLSIDCYFINMDLGHVFLENPSTPMCFNECNNPGLH